MELLKRFVKEEDGLGTVEVVMLILVLVGLAIVFRDAIEKVVKTMVNKIEKKMDS